MQNPLPEEFDNYTEKYWEDIIILLTLVSVAAIHYFIYSKIAFLDFFYLLIVLAGYYVGKRFAILGAFFANLMVWTFVLMDHSPYSQAKGVLETRLDLTVWGGFLILAAWLIGSLSEKRQQEHKEVDRLRMELEQSNQKLQERNKELEEKMKFFSRT